MSRKHFEIIAEIIAVCGGVEVGREYEINKLLRAQNANFDASRFWRAVEKHLNERAGVVAELAD